MVDGKRPSEGGNSDALIASVDALRDEVRVLRDAVDELREELQYLARNPCERRGDVVSPDDDCKDRVNAVPKQIETPLRAEEETAQEERGGATTQRRAAASRGCIEGLTSTVSYLRRRERRIHRSLIGCRQLASITRKSLN